MSPRLHAAMLGRFELWEETSPDGGEKRRVLSLPATARSLSLLAYLLLHRETPQPRDVLAEMFWPGRPPQRARRSLSTALWRIRRCFDPANPLICDHLVVQMAFPGPMIIDVECFEAAVSQAGDVEALQRAVSLYEGEFLPGIYDDWVLQERNWLQALYQDALLHLMAGYEGCGDAQAALHLALQVLEIDPCSEAAHRAAMRAYARLGQRAAALAQFQRCQDALAREMGIAPAPETIAQHQALVTREAVVPAPSSSIAPPPIQLHPEPRLPPPRQPELAPLVGREQAMARLQERWRKTTRGAGGVQFVLGEAGIGKTRILAALAERVAPGRGQVISVQCYEYERGEPYAALVDVVRSAAALGGEPVMGQLSAWQLANLARLAPELADFLPADARYMMTMVAEQKQLLRALTRLLTLLARRSPLLLLMDDLQWAHQSTLTWLPALARAAADEPMLLVAAYRVEEVAPGDLLARIVADLEAGKQAERLFLHRLTPDDLARWLHGLDAETIERIHRYTEGNPFFVQETVRTLVQKGYLKHTKRGYVPVRKEAFDLPLPDTIRQAIRSRVEDLTPTARTGLAVAAVIGRVLDLDVWERAWGEAPEIVLDALDQLLAAHLLKEGAGAFTSDYAFEHHLVREVVYLDIPRHRRRHWHLAAARALEALRGDEPGASAAIAFHFLRAEEPGLARPWLLRAGDQAVAVAATTEALTFYQQALAGYPQDAAHKFERAVLERKIGDAYFHRGEYGAAEQHLLQALTLLDRPLPQEGYPLHQAVSGALLRQIGHRVAATRAGQTAPTPALKEEVAAYTALGWMYSLQSRYEPYLLVSLRALNVSEKADYARGVAVAATALGIAADFMARYGMAAHFHQQARDVVKAVDDPSDAAFVAFGQAYHAYLMGDEPVQLAQAQLASRLYRQVGDVHRWGLARMLQAYVLAYRGQLDEVAGIGLELTTAGEEMEDAEASCSGEALLATVARWRGRWQEALAHYRRAVTLAEGIPDNMSLVEHLAGMARCQLRLGRWQEARQTLERAREIAIVHDVKGDVLGHYAVAALESTLWAAEHQPQARTDWLARAQDAVAEARKQAKAFRPAAPEVWRLCGRYEWLCGRPDAARKWWQKSLTRAEEMQHRLDWGVTALEMGLRLDAPSLRAQGRAELEKAGATGEIAFVQKAIVDTEKHEFSS